MEGKLTIQFNGLKLQVVIVKSFDISTDNPVVWTAFPPFGKDGEIDFTSEYYVYASTQKISQSLIVNMSVKEKASKGYLYNFNGNEFQQQTQLSPRVFGIENKSSNYPELTSGLAQLVNNQVDNTSTVLPINVDAVPFNMRSFFTPLAKIKVFAATGLNSSEILPPYYLTPNAQSNFNGVTVGKYLTVDFSNNTEQTIHFDSNTNEFRLGSGDSR